MKYVNLYQQLDQVIWLAETRSGHGILIYSAWQGLKTGQSMHNNWIDYPLSCWTRIYPVFANSVDPDQLASEEANWSGSTLFVIKYVNL